MTKEHKKLYKAGKNWIVATLTATTITLLGGIGAYTVHADTTAENNQSTETSNISQSSQSDNSGNLIVLSQPAPAQSNQTTENNQSVQESQINQGGNQSTSATPTTETAFAATNSSNELDPNIYGTVNVKDWDYQDSNNIINLTGYHGQDTQHIVVPNLNDFNNAGVNVDNKEAVGVTSTVLHDALRHTSDPTKAYSTIAISKTKGLLNDKVVATNDDWSGAFDSKGLIYTDDKLVGPFVLTKEDHFQLTDVDLSNLDTSKITNMMAMFNYQGHLKSINGLSNWNVSNVKNMSSMFSADPELKHLNLNNWDTSNVKDMSFMFSSSNLVVPESIENWDTHNVTNMEGMFRWNDALQSLNLNNWDTHNVTNMALMFENEAALKTVNLNNWDTHNVTNMEGMFAGTPSLTDLNLSNWDTSSLTNIEDMFFLSNIKMFHVRNSQHHFNNQVRLTDENGLMGLPGSTIALIHTPTFYKVEADKSETQIVNEIVGKLVYETAEKQYQIFYKNLDKGTQLIYPTKINLKLIYPKVILNPSDAANAELTYDMKIGKLKDAVINYVDENNKIIQTDYLTGVVGKALPIKLSIPKGYQLDENGEKVPTSLIIKEGKLQIITVSVKKIPVTVSGHINYIDPDGKVVKTDQISGKVGDKVDVKISLPDGYELANKDEHIPSVITVTENGIGTINVNVKKINTTNTGWNQQGDDWLYMQKNGYLAKGWNYLNGHWFYFDLQSGIMKTGIQSIGNSFYYLNAQHDGTYGAMKTGWQFVNGHWIGLQGSGNAYVGWQAINGHWYYFDPQTAYALTNWQDINNHWYYFDPTNAWAQTGWFKSGAGYWYFFDYANAWADTGWQKINNSWYYFDNVNSNALTGWQSINNHWYYFDPTNAWALTGWQWINGHWYWLDQANAWARTGWQYYRGQWYFMDQQNAWMDTGWTTNLANGQLYYLDKNGHPLTGWQRSLNGFWYYLQPGSDAAAIGWNWINGHWYYFNPEETINGIKAKGAMFTGRHFIDNRWNRFDLNGHWLGYEN